MFGARLFVDLDTRREDRPIRPAMTFRGAHELQIAMLVLMVVPTHELERPGAGSLQVAEHARILRSVLAGPEQTLRVGVVVAHARAAVGSIDAELLQLGDEGRALHHTAVVLVNDQP